VPKFKSNADGVVTVSAPGQSTGVTFEPGQSVEVDEPEVVAALRANPDVSEVKSSSKKK
jgi:hypothetical protein